MNPLTAQELERIVARDLPGHELIPGAPEGSDTGPNTSTDADAPGADIDALRAHFLGPDAPVHDGITPAPTPVNHHDVIVAVRPTGPTDPFDVRAHPRAVIVSGRERRVIGEQG